MAMQGAVERYIDDLKVAGGLKGSDIANIADVSKATVSRWSKGTAHPHLQTQMVLSDLHYVVSRLQEYYTPKEIRLWLFGSHPQLQGERAIDLINNDQSKTVLEIIERMDSGAYL